MDPIEDENESDFRTDGLCKIRLVARTASEMTTTMSIMDTLTVIILHDHHLCVEPGGLAQMKFLAQGTHSMSDIH